MADSEAKREIDFALMERTCHPHLAIIRDRELQCVREIELAEHHYLIVSQPLVRALELWGSIAGVVLVVAILFAIDWRRSRTSAPPRP